MCSCRVTTPLFVEIVLLPPLRMCKSSSCAVRLARRQAFWTGAVASTCGAIWLASVRSPSAAGAASPSTSEGSTLFSSLATSTWLNSSLTSRPPTAASILGSASSRELVLVQLSVSSTCLLTHTASTANTPTMTGEREDRVDRPVRVLASTRRRCGRARAWWAWPTSPALARQAAQLRKAIGDAGTIDHARASSHVEARKRGRLAGVDCASAVRRRSREDLVMFRVPGRSLAIAALLLGALVLAGCGESSQEKATAQVCAGADSDITKQVKMLSELTLSTNVLSPGQDGPGSDRQRPHEDQGRTAKPRTRAQAAGRSGDANLRKPRSARS